MLIGYSRVSTHEQNLHLQADALHAAGAEKIFQDKISGARGDRPGLNEALTFARPGDILAVWRLDRLGRSLPHLIETVRDLEARGVGFRSLTEQIDTSSTGGRLIFHVFASLAEFERDLIRDRTKAGLAAARARGRVGGRPRAMSDSKFKAAEKMLADGMPARSVAEVVGCSIPTLYRWFPANRAHAHDPAPAD